MRPLFGGSTVSPKLHELVDLIFITLTQDEHIIQYNNIISNLAVTKINYIEQVRKVVLNTSQFQMSLKILFRDLPREKISSDLG